MKRVTKAEMKQVTVSMRYLVETEVTAEVKMRLTMGPTSRVVIQISLERWMKQF